MVHSSVDNLMHIRKTTQDEAARYDRQMRLWGETNQRKIINSTAYIDFLSDASSEIIKNLVLKGIGNLIIGFIPESDHILHQLNMNNVFHVLKGENIVQQLFQLNPYVKVTIGDDDFTTGAQNFQEGNIVFVYHTLSLARNHQVKISHSIQGSRTSCLCISLYGDIGRICNFYPNLLQDMYTESMCSTNAGGLERDFYVIHEITEKLVTKSIEKNVMHASNVNSVQTVEIRSPAFHSLLEEIQFVFKKSNRTISDERVTVLAESIACGFKQYFLLNVYTKFGRNILIQFVESTGEFDLSVSVGVELASIVGGIGAQDAISALTGYYIEKQSHEVDKHVVRCTFVDSWDRCEAEVSKSPPPPPMSRN